MFLAACATPQEQPQQVLEPDDGGTIQLDARRITKELGGSSQDMYGYNGQVPGPLIRVRQGSTLFVNFTNDLEEPTTIHWHGLRHDVKDDGVPGVSQEPVPPGGSFLYELRFPDEGIYWYHPHVREDRQQDLGLYGNILVLPAENAYAPVEHEEFLILDDILLENGRIVPHGHDGANFALMGRYGNTLLVNGKERYNLTVSQGETVRFYVTAAPNARPFNITFGAPIKRIGGDLGRYEREEYVDSLVIAPAERYIIEVTFDDPGTYLLRSVNPWTSYDLGEITVAQGMERSSPRETRVHPDVIADIDRYRGEFNRTPDMVLRLGVDLRMHGGMHAGMHSVLPIEWEDTMQEMNRHADARQAAWFIEDETGARNMNIMRHFTQGDVVKIRIINDAHSDHPMQHPIHLHGQRFLVIEQDGVRSGNLVWKDTVLVPAGSTVDLIADLSNPGEWMIHCHIAEHVEAGMMAMISVAPHAAER